MIWNSRKNHLFQIVSEIWKNSNVILEHNIDKAINSMENNINGAVKDMEENIDKALGK